MRIQLEAELSKGGFSSVKLARNLDTLEPVAAKVIYLDENGSILFRSEVELLQRLPEDKNIPKLLGVTMNKEKNQGLIVIEYLPFPSLRTFLKDQGRLSEVEAIDVLRQLIDVVLMLQVNGIAHRDLKPDNIIINPDNYNIKLIDFGLGIDLKEGENSVDNTYRGTPVYMPPEVVRNDKSFYNVMKAEIWTIGIIFFELLTGRNPYAHCRTPEELLMEQHRGFPFHEVTGTCGELLRRMVCFNTSERATFCEIRQIVGEASPRRIAPHPNKKAWSCSRAHTFENLRTFTPVQGQARSGEKNGILTRMYAALIGDEPRKAE